MPPRKKQSPDRDTGNVYDRTLKQLMDELALPIVNRFLNLNLELLRRLPEKHQTVLEREPDFLSMVKDETGAVFILHIEFQSEHDPKMMARMKEYHGIIYKKYEMPIRHFLFYFGAETPNISNRLAPERIFTGFEVVHFKKQDYESLLNAEHCHEILLAVLADFGGKPGNSVLQEIIHRLRDKSQSEKELKGHLNQLTILSRLRNLHYETIKLATAMPIYFDITSDPIYQQGLQVGDAGGFLKGELKGKLEGKLEGELKGKLEGALFQNLKFLCGMAEAKIPVSVILQGSDAPEPFVGAFLASFSREKGERLLTEMRQKFDELELKYLHRSILQGLKKFGIPQVEAEAYLKWISPPQLS